LKTISDAVVGTFLTVNVLLVMWAIESPLVDVNTVIPLGALDVLSGVGVVSIVAYSWQFGKPYKVTWLHLSIGALGVGSTVLWARFLLLLAEIGDETFLLVLSWLAAFGWGVALALFLKWLADPAPLPLKEQPRLWWPDH